MTNLSDQKVIYHGGYSDKAVEVLRLVKAGTPYANNAQGRGSHLSWLQKKGLVETTGGFPSFRLTDFGQYVLEYHNRKRQLMRFPR